MRKAIALLLLAACGGGSGGSSESTTTATDPRFALDAYDASRVQAGTTFFCTNYDNEPRILQVDMNGAVVWEYVVPEELRDSGAIALDAEYLADTDTILVASGGVGLFEISYPGGEVLWLITDTNEGPVKVSHDADRLPNGNLLYAYGHNDVEGVDYQATEIAPDGTVVWKWAAWEHPEFDAYSGTNNGGWVHANAVQRLANGNTMISLRNFHITVEVNSAGDVVNLYDWSVEYGLCDPHEPEFANGKVLVALQHESPWQAVEIEWPTGAVVQTIYVPGLRTTRDADRLANGNILLMGVLNQNGTEDSVILEVAPDGTVVWQVRLVGYSETMTPGFIYKAQRV